MDTNDPSPRPPSTLKMIKSSTISSTPSRKSTRKLRPRTSAIRTSVQTIPETMQNAVPLLSAQPSEQLFSWLQSRTHQDRNREKSPVHPSRVSTFALLSHSTLHERYLMILGALMALVSGCGMPAWLILVARALDTFSSLAAIIVRGGGDQARQTLLEELSRLCVGFAVVGAVTLVSGTAYVGLWTYTGERQVLRIKDRYVRSVFRQDMGWFDTRNREELPTVIASATGRIGDAIGRKMPDTLSNLWAGFACLGVSLYLNGPLSLVMLLMIPVVAITIAVVSVFIRRSAEKSNRQFAAAGAIATEAISGIKTVASLNAESWVLTQYTNLCQNGQDHSIHSGFYSSLAAGLTGLLFYTAYALAFWVGTVQVAESVLTLKCILKKDCGVSGASVMVCVYGVMLSATFFGLMAPGMQAINLGRQSAVDIFDTVKRVPVIDASKDAAFGGMEGEEKLSESGDLEMRNVYFAYPSDMSKLIFSNFNLKIPRGSSIALVGPSGSGKSTVSKLLLRFYDPISGDVLWNGSPITSLSVRQWRDGIGHVSQEPVLFPGTFRENIVCGFPDATDEMVRDAARAACAEEFILSFPAGYDESFGGASTQLSGGQIQRIAIARAVLKEPRILLLDEATSALDSNSERTVQEALANIRKWKKITTVTVAHRLSTIIGSDQIAVISEGGVREMGTHEELFALKGGIYKKLCESQGIVLESGSKSREGVVVKGGGIADPVGKEQIEEESMEITFDQDSHNSQWIPASTLPFTGDIVDVENPTKKLSVQPQHDEQLKPHVQEDDQEDLAPISRLWEYNKSEWAYLLLGVVGACVVGALPPSEAIITAQIVNNFYQLSKEEMRAANTTLSLQFLILAACSVMGNIAMGIGFSVAGFRLTRRMRCIAFEAIIRHSMEWFDVPEHSTGELTSRLEEDAEAVAKVTGWSLGYRIRVLATLLAGTVIALVFSWQIGLVAIACIPLTMGAAVIQARCVKRDDPEDHDGESPLSPATILEQGLRGIVSVQAYNLQDKFADDHSAALQPDAADRTRRGIVAGLVFGFSQFAIFASFSILFAVGSKLMVAQIVGFVDFFTALLAVMFGAFGIAQINADFNAKKEGLEAAARIFGLVDEPIDPATDPFGTGGVQPDSLQGKIDFEVQAFAYPTRPDKFVYYASEDRPDGFRLTVKPDESVAFVGKSGCGKSTALQILLRFYDVSGGKVTLDDRPLDSLNVKWIRSNIGYVGQNPVLFAGSVRQNISLGNKEATQEQIREAAMAADAHDFIMDLSQQYDTDIGAGGSLLSGGQRQRIAIARAIVKNPKILVLDEATSALDNESERVVQRALDELRRKQKRTTLIVAHRLITVKDCDVIVVLDGGGIKESGTHEDLLKEGGLYSNLWRMQVGSSSI